MFDWIQRYWWKRQRAIDVKILWPQCVEQAPSLERAHQAFFIHAFQDKAWVMVYGADLWNEVKKLK